MDPHRLQSLQQSFSAIEPIAETLVPLFYSRLFELDPSLRQLFSSDLKVQGEKLMASVKSIIADLDNPERIALTVRRLGKRCARYGIQPNYYAVVGEALLWTLESGLGPAYTPEFEVAWASTYRLLSAMIQDAAAEAIHASTLCNHPGYA